MVGSNSKEGKRPPCPTAADEQLARSGAFPLDDIRTDGTQTRAGLNEEAVEDYKAAYQAGEQLPEVALFHDGTDYWMGDGFHRHEAAKRAGLRFLPVVVRKGTQRDALLYSAGANATNGVRRTKEDKRRAVELLLQDQEWSQATSRWIAERCHVSHTFVDKLRAGHASAYASSGNVATARNGESETPQTRMASDGRRVPTSQPKPFLCDRCQRVGAVPDCPRCAEARKRKGIDGHGRKPKRKTAKRKPAEVRDALGNVVPDHLRDVFADTQLAEMVATLEGIFAQFKPEPWVEKAGKLCDHHGFILIDKFSGHLYDGLARIQLATEALIAGLPHAVCPKCQGVDSKKDGETCRGCRGFGAVPKHRYEELTRA
jgi:hypothetical protein